MITVLVIDSGWRMEGLVLVVITVLVIDSGWRVAGLVLLVVVGD